MSSTPAEEEEEAIVIDSDSDEETTETNVRNSQYLIHFDNPEVILPLHFGRSAKICAHAR